MPKQRTNEVLGLSLPDIPLDAIRVERRNGLGIVMSLQKGTDSKF
jgi:hypothetical protein